MTTLTEIEARAKALSEARAKLAEIVTELNYGIDAIKRSYMSRLKVAVNRAAWASSASRARKAVSARRRSSTTAPRNNPVAATASISAWNCVTTSAP